MSNTPSQEKLRILSLRPEKYTITIAGKTAYPVPSDGRLIIQIPRLPSGDATYFLGARVANDSSYNVPAIHLDMNQRTLRSLSLTDFAKLPVDDQGYHLLKAE